jgi:hypothetical protein
MVEAIAGRMSWGVLENSHNDDADRQIVFKCGEENRLG